MKTTKYLLAATLAVTGMTFVPTLRAADDNNATNAQTNTATDQTTAAQQNSQTSADTANTNANTANNNNTTANNNTAANDNTAANNAAGANNADVNNNTNNTTAANNTNMSDNTTASANDNLNNGVKDTHWVNNVREQIREITNAALTKNDLEAIRNRLTVADQKRLGDIKNMDGDDLNSVIKDIDQKWKDKYNHHFDINTKTALSDSFVRIDSINKAETASDTNSNKTENREIANVTVAADQDNKLPEANLTFLREHMSWKLQLPAAVDGAALKNNLLMQLQAINNDSANWPADETQAYRCVSHRILLGLSGQGMNNAQPAASNTNGM